VRWNRRFFQTFLGIVEVDAHARGEQALLSIIEYLLHNKISVPISVPALRL
jgi:hypothetical protein